MKLSLHPLIQQNQAQNAKISIFQVRNKESNLRYRAFETKHAGNPETV